VKSNLLQLITLTAALGFCATATADTTINEVFTCQLKEGKTMDDVRAANSKWVKFMNANVAGGNIGSSIATNVVGNATSGYFLYVDTFPSLESWSTAKSATEGDDEGEAIDAELGEVADCSDNRLYSSEES
jgi:hypothetical protein